MTSPVPDAKSFHKTMTLNVKGKAHLGDGTDAVPSTKGPVELTVHQRGRPPLIPNPDYFTVYNTADMTPYAGGITVQAPLLGDKTLIKDGGGTILAYFVKEGSGRNIRYAVCSTRPYVEGHKPDPIHTYEGKQLYTWFKVGRDAFGNSQCAIEVYQVPKKPGDPDFVQKFESEQHDAAKAVKEGIRPPVSIKQMDTGDPVALVKHAEKPNVMAGPAYDLVICPGTDPLAVICFSVVLTRLYFENRQLW